MKEKFQTKLLIRQNMSLCAQLQSYQYQFAYCKQRQELMRQDLLKACRLIAKLKYKNWRMPAQEGIELQQGNNQYGKHQQQIRQCLNAMCKQLNIQEDQPKLVFNQQLNQFKEQLDVALEENRRLRHRLTITNAYDSQLVQLIIRQPEQHFCDCGGAQLQIRVQNIHQNSIKHKKNKEQIKQKGLNQHKKKKQNQNNFSPIKMQTEVSLHERNISPVEQDHKVIIDCSIKDQIMMRAQKQGQKMQIDNIKLIQVQDTNMMQLENLKIMQEEQRSQQGKQFKFQSNNTILQNVLIKKLIQAQQKLQMFKLNRRSDIQMVLSSKQYFELRKGTQQLMLFTSQLLNKIGVQQQRIKQLEDLSKKEIEKVITQSNNLKLSIKRQSILENTAVEHNLKIVQKQLQEIKAIQTNVFKMLETTKGQFGNFQNVLNDRNKLLKQKERFYFRKRLHKFSPYDFHSPIIKLLQNQATLQFCNQKGIIINLKNASKNLKRFVNYTIQLQSRQDTRQERQEVQQQPPNIISNLSSINVMLQQINIQYSCVQKMLAHMQKQLVEMESHYCQHKAFQSFKKIKQRQQKYQLQRQIQKWKDKQQTVVDVVQLKNQILTKVQQVRFQAKLKEGTYLANIQEQHKKIQDLAQKSIIMEQIIKKNTSDKVQLRHQIDRLTHNTQSQADQNLMRELEHYKAKVICVCGRGNLANHVFESCGHILCKTCIQTLHSTRKRTCPICNVKFSAQQIHSLKYNN